MQPICNPRLLTLEAHASVASLLLVAMPACASSHAAKASFGIFVPLLIGLAAGLAFVHRLRQRTRELEAQIQHAATENAALRRELEALREREHAARINARRFRSLTSLTSDWYWEQDSDYRFTMRTSWLLGEEQLPRGDFIGRPLWELPGLVGAVDWDAHREILDKRWPFRGLEYQIQQGEQLHWVSVNGEPMYDESGQFIGYRGTGRDITRRKTTEAALRASEERFGEIVSSMPVGLLIKDAESRVILMNHECERLWGVRLADIKDRDGAQFFPPDDLAGYQAMDRAAFTSREMQESIGICRNILTGETATVKTVKKPVFAPDGTPRYLIAILQDITEQKQAEELLRRSREALRQLARHQASVKEEERKRIARDIHDELGQNLMALRLDVATLVQQQDADAAKLSQHATLMMETVDRTIRSVRQIINDLRPAVLDLGLSAALEWQVEDFTKRFGISCKLDVEVDDRALGLDDRHATTLFRVLQESLNNVQRHAAATEVRVGLSREGAMLRLTVSDNGLGGVSRKSRGGQTFGLLGMRERLRMLGGSLAVDDLPKGGTALIATVPLPAQAPEHQD